LPGARAAVERVGKLVLTKGIFMLAAFVLGGGEIFILLLMLFLMAFWIWMIIDCIRNERLSEGEKIAWVLAIVLTHFLGALIYHFVVRKRAAAAKT
jgi:hypothetical protein